MEDIALVIPQPGHSTCSKLLTIQTDEDDSRKETGIEAITMGTRI